MNIYVQADSDKIVNPVPMGYHFCQGISFFASVHGFCERFMCWMINGKRFRTQNL